MRSVPSRRSRLVTLATAVVVVVGTFAGWGAAGFVAVGFLVLSPIEKRFRRHPWPTRRPGVRTDVHHALFSSVLFTVAIAVAIGLSWLVFNWFEIGPVADALDAAPRGVQFLAAFLGFEVLGYWYHRWSHEHAFLWKFHKVHHSSRMLDWASAARLHPAEGFFAGLLIAPPALLLGIRPVDLGAVSVLMNIWAVLLHANIRWRFRWLDGIVGTPEYHHWHHSNHPESWNKNYSGLMPVLDRIWGTYYQPTDRRPWRYGIDEEVPDTWWGQVREPLRRRRHVAA